jgi:hypothetical protein
MTVSIASLQKLISLNLSTEQMAGVMEVLAVELAPLEAHEQERRERLAKDRERKFRGKVQGNSTEIPRKPNGNSTEIPRKASRVEDNYNLPTLLDTSRKNLSPPPPLPSRALEPDGFEEFWEAYPKRDGSADRKGAAKAFKAALRRATLETILDGTDHFRDAMTARGKVGTEYIPQARTWLNGDRWHERFDIATAADSKQAQNLAILEKYRAAPRS